MSVPAPSAQTEKQHTPLEKFVALPLIYRLNLYFASHQDLFSYDIPELNVRIIRKVSPDRKHPGKFFTQYSVTDIPPQ